MYKNIRYLYVKDGVIVEYERARRRAQANALSLAEVPWKELKHVKERIAALAADSFFMVHNYRSACFTPSKTDKELAALFSKVPELKGYIIINPNWFGLIIAKGVGILRVLPFMPPPPNAPVSEAYLTPTRIMDLEVLEIAAWTSTVTKRKKKPVIFSLSEEATLRDLQKISLDKIDTWNRLADKMAERIADRSGRRPSLDEAGPLLRHGGRYYL
jgi:hypothetical protein